MKTKKISQREFLKKLENIISESWIDMDQIKSSTKAEGLCLSLIACLEVYGEDPDNVEPEMKDKLGTLYDDLMMSGMSFKSPVLTGVSVTKDSCIPYICGSDKFGSKFVIYLDSSMDLRGYMSPTDSDKMDIVLAKFEQSLEIENGDRVKPELCESQQYIPNSKRSNTCELSVDPSYDMSKFQKTCATKLSKWSQKEFTLSMKLPGALGIVAGNTQGFSKTKMLYSVAAILTNICNDSYNISDSKKVREDIESTVLLNSVEDFEVLGCGTVGSIPYISCRIRTSLSCPWIQYYIYHTGHSFRAYVPISGNWINPETKEPLFTKYDSKDIEWLQKDGLIIEDLNEEELIDLAWELERVESEQYDYMPTPVNKVCLEEFRICLPVTEEVVSEEVVEEKEEVTKEKSLSDLRISELEEMVSYLRSNYIVESAPLLVQIENTIQAKKDVMDKIDMTQFNGKLFEYIGKNFKIYVNVITCKNCSDIDADTIIKTPDSLLRNSNKCSCNASLYIGENQKLICIFSGMTLELIESKKKKDYEKLCKVFS